MTEYGNVEDDHLNGLQRIPGEEQYYRPSKKTGQLKLPHVVYLETRLLAVTGLP
jgi:hypothetical protein